MDLDALLEKNRYGGEDQKPSIEALLAKNKYGGKNSGATEVVNIAPEYPHDVDIGPLFCRSADRCFLDGGGLCGAYQSGNRNKGMLQDLYNACKETGFFFVYNTMVEDQTLQTVYEHTLRIHTAQNAALKEEVRAEARDCLTAGWVPYKSHPAYDAGIIANRCSYHITPPVQNGTEPWQVRKWPSTDLVGDDFEPDIARFYEQSEVIAKGLAAAFSRMLGLDDDYFAKLRTDKSLSLLQLSYYPPQQPSPDSRDMLGAQTDGVLFSIVNQNCPGLQVQDAQGRWCNVRCSSERFIVLIGDAMEVVTGGEIRATKHRNITMPHERAMITFRAGLDPDVVLAPHELYDDGSGDYAPRTQMEHFKMRNKALTQRLGG